MPQKKRYVPSVIKRIPRRIPPRKQRTWTIGPNTRAVVNGLVIESLSKAVLRFPGTPSEQVRIEKIAPPPLQFGAESP